MDNNLIGRVAEVTPFRYFLTGPSQQFNEDRTIVVKQEF